MDFSEPGAAPSSSRQELIEVYAKLAASELRANQMNEQLKTQCRITEAALNERAALAEKFFRAPMTDSDIKATMLSNGFVIKDGPDDLKPYVYAAARAIEAHCVAESRKQ